MGRYRVGREMGRERDCTAVHPGTWAGAVWLPWARHSQRQHLLKTYCVLVEALWVEMRPTPTAVGRGDFPVMTAQCRASQLVQEGCTLASWGLQKGWELEHV